MFSSFWVRLGFLLGDVDILQKAATTFHSSAKHRCHLQVYASARSVPRPSLPWPSLLSGTCTGQALKLGKGNTRLTCAGFPVVEALGIACYAHVLMRSD